MIKIYVNAQTEPKFVEDSTPVICGSKWIQGAMLASELKSGDNIMLNDAWYTVKSTEKI